MTLWNHFLHFASLQDARLKFGASVATDLRIRCVHENLKIRCTFSDGSHLNRLYNRDTMKHERSEWFSVRVVHP